LPELYLHGLAKGDFELALRGLLGEGLPCLRTSNVVESPFAAIRLRTDAAKRYKSVANATAMIWKLLRVAEKSFRRLKGHDLLPEVFEGKQFVDGFPLKAKKKLERAAA
jgi:hypothetical protein